MNRRKAIKSIIASGILLGMNLSAKEKEAYKFNITMNGDLDDDLIVLKSTEEKTKIVDIHQMHNSSGIFHYAGENIKIKHNPGFINFTKNYEFINDEVYFVCLANEREDAGYQKNFRVRTHYKNEKLLFNESIFLEALMPEYNSVPNYPKWFEEDEIPRFDRQDINGETYNYYNLYENTIVQMGIVIKNGGKIKLQLFNEKDELKYTFESVVSSVPKLLKSNELLKGELNEHKFTEVNNILNLKLDEQIENNSYINTLVLEVGEKTYSFELPYPLMYPNLISAVSCK